VDVERVIVAVRKVWLSGMTARVDWERAIRAALAEREEPTP
jgi:hypothetical protein